MTGIRVLQATAWYPPHSMGGTEVYVEGLVAECHQHTSCPVPVAHDLSGNL